MKIPSFIEKLWCVETLFGVIILAAAIWAGFVNGAVVTDAAKAAFTARERADQNEIEVNRNAARIDHLENKVETVASAPPPVVVVRKIDAKPFDNRAVLERARRLREQQRASEQNR